MEMLNGLTRYQITATSSQVALEDDQVPPRLRRPVQLMLLLLSVAQYIISHYYCDLEAIRAHTPNPNPTRQARSADQVWQMAVPT